ncbi:MAG: XTP/dITP diphosphatase [Desulfotomaculaceae bacterium]
MKIFLATENNGKIQELKRMLPWEEFDVQSIKDYPNYPEVTEDGKTFKENALKKARIAAEYTDLLSLADDSGLEVDFLDGAPGIYSARFAGEGSSDEANNRKLLKLLNGASEGKRTARFRCAVAIAEPGGKSYTAEGICEGIIAAKPAGEGGFGYDPLFYMPRHECTLAEMDMVKKNEISHRGQAMRGAMEILKMILT